MMIIDNSHCQYKPKIYIAYKAETSKYLAYILYKRLASDDSYDFFYDRANVLSITRWKELMDYHINQCDMVIVIGEQGAFDSLQYKNCRDPFIQEIKKGLEKKKIVYYIPIENYRFWEDKRFHKASLIHEAYNPSESKFTAIQSERKLRINPIFNRLAERQLTPINFESKTPEQFEMDLEILKNHLDSYFSAKYKKDMINMGSLDWDRQSTMSQQIQIIQKTKGFIPKKKY